MRYINVFVLTHSQQLITTTTNPSSNTLRSICLQFTIFLAIDLENKLFFLRDQPLWVTIYALMAFLQKELLPNANLICKFWFSHSFHNKPLESRLTSKSMKFLVQIHEFQRQNNYKWIFKQKNIQESRI